MLTFASVFVVKHKTILISFTRVAASVVVPERVISSAVINVALKIQDMILQVRVIKLAYVAMSIPPEHQRKIGFPNAVQRDTHAVRIKVARFSVSVPVDNRSVFRVYAAMIVV
tara:strand:+ start:430 stop:768 length:339 start_codon:yes stop_codon:yes gene_type:complete